jgi:hypothetical protein
VDGGVAVVGVVVVVFDALSSNCNKVNIKTQKR